MVSVRERYEAAGEELLAELRSLPLEHPLSRWLTTSGHYQAVLRNNPKGSEWTGRLTSIGVREDYLLRFDLLASFSGGGLNSGPTAARIGTLVKELRVTGHELRKAVASERDQESNAEMEALKWLDSELVANLENLERASLTVKRAKQLVLSDLYSLRLSSIQERLLAQVESGQLPTGEQIEELLNDEFSNGVFFEILKDRDTVRSRILRLWEWDFKR